MTGPLVPAPGLPFEDGAEAGTPLRVRRGFTRQAAAIDLGPADGPTLVRRLISPADAPALAAAVLAAAGLEHHRVIDLGGPLPEVGRRKDGAGWTVQAYGTFYDESAKTGTYMEAVRAYLAVLEARAATPKHDPAEVEAVRRALAKANGTEWDLMPPGSEDCVYRRDALAVLDALAAVRATGDPS